MNLTTSGTDGSDRFVVTPNWMTNAVRESPTPDIPQWGERLEGVRMYEYDGEPDEYNDIRFGQLDDGRLAIGIGCSCGCGYAFIDIEDLKGWITKR